MTGIEELESLVMVWKAASQAAKKTGHTKLHSNLEAKIADAKAALAILKQPSNTRMQSDGLIAHCQKCKEKVKDWPKYKRDCMGKVGHR